MECDHTWNSQNYCMNCEMSLSDYIHEQRVSQEPLFDGPISVELKTQLLAWRQMLLAWMGFHRGGPIHEEAVPRFHELIDKLDELLGLPPESR